MNESASEYQLKILDLATNRYLDQIAPPSEDNLQYIESNVDEVVWKVATQIYQQSGFKADLMRVKDIVISRIENMRLQLKLKAEQEAAEEAQRAAKLRAEEERKAAEEAQRAAKLRAEAERRAAEEAKRVAELLEKFDGNQNKVEIFIKIRKMVSEELKIDELAIDLDTNIGQDLNAESLEIFELIMAVEEEFDIEIDDEEAGKLYWTEKEYASYKYDHYNPHDPPYKSSSSSDPNSSSSKYAWLGMLSSASSITSRQTYSIPPTGTVRMLVDYIYQKINETTETE